MKLWNYMMVGILTSLAGSSALASPVVFDLKSSAVVEKNQFTVADILSSKEIPQEIWQGLSEVVLGATPDLGSRRMVSKDWVHSRLQQKLQLADEIQVGGANVCELRRQSQEIGGRDLDNLVHRTLAKELQLKAEGVTDITQAELNPLRVGTSLVLPEGEVVAAAKFTEDPLKGGWVPFEFRLAVNEETRTLRGNAKVNVFRMLPVPRRNIERFQTVSADDFEMQAVNLAEAHADPVTQIDEIAGRALSKNITKGQVIARRLVTAPWVIRSGDTVTLQVKGNGILITVKAIAMKDAAVGEIIPVRNVVSQKRVDAVVFSKDEVRVEL